MLTTAPEAVPSLQTSNILPSGKAAGAGTSWVGTIFDAIPNLLGKLMVILYIIGENYLNT
jgi:hypothetical protein